MSRWNASSRERTSPGPKNELVDVIAGTESVPYCESDVIAGAGTVPYCKNVVICADVGECTGQGNRGGAVNTVGTPANSCNGVPDRDVTAGPLPQSTQRSPRNSSDRRMLLAKQARMQ